MEISDLYKLDNLDVCKNSFYKDFHVWYAIRYSVLNEVFMKIKKLDQPVKKQKKRLKVILPFIFQSIKYRPPLKNYDIVYFTSTAGNMYHDGIYMNRLCDYFYEQFPDKSLILEEPYFFEYRRPRAVPVSYTGWFSLKLKILSMLKVKNTNDVKCISDIVEKIKNELSLKFSNNFWDEITVIAVKTYSYFITKKKMYRKYLKVVQPKIIFQNCASYGIDQALSLVCKELGIIYAELQHGFIGKEHIAYNYGEAFFSNPLRSLLPSFFMIFGKYWGEQIHHPATQIPVGFPYLQLQAKKKLDDINEKFILLISDGVSPSQNKLIIDWLSEFISLHKYRVVLKLHPIEVPRKDEWYSDILSNEYVQIKGFDPVYPLVHAAEIIIGAGSTVMFESLCFGKSPLVFCNEHVLGDGNFVQIFDTFNTKQELLKLLEKQNHLNTIDSSRFFDKGWKNNFSSFISKLLSNSI